MPAWRLTAVERRRRPPRAAARGSARRSPPAAAPARRRVPRGRGGADVPPVHHPGRGRGRQVAAGGRVRRVAWRPGAGGDRPVPGIRPRDHLLAGGRGHPPWRRNRREMPRRMSPWHASGEVLGEEPEAERIAAGRRVASSASRTAPPAPEEIFWAIRKTFEAMARSRPLILVFDDVHWGEPTFLDLVDHIADWTRDAPILLIAMARAELLEKRPAWGGGKRWVTTMSLEPLSEDRERGAGRRPAGPRGAPGRPPRADQPGGRGQPTLRRGAARQAHRRRVPGPVGRRLVGHTGTCRELAIPPSIQALLAARLDGLDGEERTVIERASVEGKVFHRGAVTELAPEPMRPAGPRPAGQPDADGAGPPGPGLVRRRGGVSVPPPAHPRRRLPGAGQADPIRAPRAVRSVAGAGCRRSAGASTRRSSPTTSSRRTGIEPSWVHPMHTPGSSPSRPGPCWPMPASGPTPAAMSRQRSTYSVVPSSCCRTTSPDDDGCSSRSAYRCYDAGDGPRAERILTDAIADADRVGDEGASALAAVVLVMVRMSTQSTEMSEAHPRSWNGWPASWSGTAMTRVHVSRRPGRPSACSPWVGRARQLQRARSLVELGEGDERLAAGGPDRAWACPWSAAQPRLTRSSPSCRPISDRARGILAAGPDSRHRSHEGAPGPASPRPAS